jgi:iron complex transport system ATP-binding protein
MLLLDEPTANLDIGYQSMLLELASRLNREEGVTVIAAIHDINLAVHHFNRFILLAGGRVMAAGRLKR